MSLKVVSLDQNQDVGGGCHSPLKGSWENPSLLFQVQGCDCQHSFEHHSSLCLHGLVVPFSVCV